MYNLSLSQAPAEGVTRDQLREQIRAQVKQATDEARAALREAEAAQAQAEGQGRANPGVPDAPMAPIGIPTIAVRGMPWERDIPPRVKDVSIAFFVTFAFIIVGFPIMRAIGKRIGSTSPADLRARRRDTPPHTRNPARRSLCSRRRWRRMRPGS